jgi:hypothetical protein
MYEAFWKFVRFARSHSRSLAIGVRKAVATGVSFAFAVAPAASGILPAPAEAKARPATPQEQTEGGNQCLLQSAQGAIKHVIYIQFDNLHFKRDNPNVPSDLEQMPHLLKFLENQGSLLTNHHTPLISHTADDILTSLTGVYGDRHGISVANSYGAYRPDGSTGFPSSFFYWTNLVSDVNPSTKDTTFGMLTAEGKNAPAPWVPFTRAGCDVGVFAMANMIIERTSFDVPKIFGAGSPEASEDADHQLADFEGVGVHCAQQSSLCSASNHGVADTLPDEPGGYTGFNALFGAKYLSQALGSPVKDLDGNVIVNADTGLPGFAGFDPLATQSLGYIATMQEAGIPITFAYISDAHDDHVNGVAYGPGQSGYVAQLAAYDRAFDQFFTRLEKDGITPRNTLFVVTSDEDDHFAGGSPTPSTCDGVKVPCTYSKIGEIDSNIQDLLIKQDPTLAGKPFGIHFDMAPTFYLKGQPARGDATARAFERAAAKLSLTSVITGNTDKLTRYLADPVEMKLLHMITADAKRTPTFTLFGNPDYFFLTFGADAAENPGFAWNHGGVAAEINTTWLGLVGPGVKNEGVTDQIWSDHTDIRPTMLSLVGLQDDYQSQGRVLVEELLASALPSGVKDSGDEFAELASAYKRINAPVGELGLATLKISTAALAGDDATYNELENQLQLITAERDALAAKMLDRLSAAEFGGKHVSHGKEQTMVRQANALVDYVNSLAAQSAGK